jgi:hypothetical protein
MLLGQIFAAYAVLAAIAAAVRHLRMMLDIFIFIFVFFDK